MDDTRLLQAVAAAASGATAAGGGLLRSATVANPMDVGELLAQADALAATAEGPACGLRSAGSAGAAGGGEHWVQPSGAQPARLPRCACCASPARPRLPTLNTHPHLTPLLGHATWRIPCSAVLAPLCRPAAVWRGLRRR